MLGHRRDPFTLSVEEAAATPTGKGIAPHAITLVPQVTLPHTAACDWREGAQAFAVGTRLWEVQADGESIGHITLTSPFVASAFGDQQLAFAHASPSN